MDKSALRSFLPKPIVTSKHGVEEAMETSGQECWGMGFGEQLVLFGTRTFVCTSLCVGWNLDREWEESSMADSNPFSSTSHTCATAPSRQRQNKPGLSLSLPTLRCFPFKPVFLLLAALLLQDFPSSLRFPSFPFCYICV